MGLTFAVSESDYLISCHDTHSPGMTLKCNYMRRELAQSIVFFDIIELERCDSVGVFKTLSEIYNEGYCKNG